MGKKNQNKTLPLFADDIIIVYPKNSKKINDKTQIIKKLINMGGYKINLQNQ